MSGNLASVGITASAAGNGILVLIALIIFAFAGGVAFIVIKPVNWWAVLVAAGLAIYMAALLVGS